MLHASKTWPLTMPNLQRLQQNYRAMIRQICNLKPQDIVTIRSNELFVWLGIEDLDLILKAQLVWTCGMLQWCIKTACDGKRGPGRPKMTRKQLTKRDCRGSSWLSTLMIDTPGDLVRFTMCTASQLHGRGPTDEDILFCTYTLMMMTKVDTKHYHLSFDFEL